MDSFQQLLAVATAEMRSSRRLARTWLFIALSALIGLVAYAYYTVVHGLFSNMSATVGLVHARFLIASSGFLWTAIFMVAITFLAFDIRARDARSQMVEVLDVRPIGNVALLGGRLLGVVLIAWLPLAFLVVLIQGIGMAGTIFDWPFGEPVQPTSILAFLIVDAPLTFALWGAIVIFLATALRNRLIVAGVALALFGLLVWQMSSVPIYLLPALTGMTSMSYTASDLLPRFIDATIFGQRVCVLAMTLGLLLFAAALHPRRDRASQSARLGVAATLVAVGSAGIAALVLSATDAVAQRVAWRTVHEQQRDAPRVLVDRVAGRVVIEPGEALRLELDYQLTAPAAQSLDQLVFSFNPGMTIDELRVAGEQHPFTHESGLLTVSVPLAAGAGAELSLAARGIPDAAFGYLDSALDVALLSGGDANLLLLGREASIYADGYVALMPAVYWLPMPGVAVEPDGMASGGRDYFEVDLEVEVPAHWLVAGPGRRQGEAGRTGRFRFRPATPVPEVALLAAAFERYALEVAGVDMELLMTAEHPRNVALFAEAAEQIGERVGEWLEEADQLGLPYPYGALSLVEAPAALRGYGGGWRMASVQSLPGIALLRENSFPTARFERRFSDSDELRDAEGGAAGVKARVLESFFQNDVSGGNLLQGALRNVFAFQTSARGEGAVALDFLAHELAVQLVTQRRSSYFTAHSFGDGADFQTLVSQSILSGATGQTQSLGDSVYMAATNRPQIWDRALGAALADLDTRTDPVTALNVLWLKVPSIAEAIIDALGRETTAALLAELRRRHAGGNFTAADFVAAAVQVGADLDAVVGDWLHDTALPGFLASAVGIFRLADDEQGQPRYQISVHVHNDEAVPGLVRLSIGKSIDGEWVADQTAPVRLAGKATVELGLVTSSPPTQVRVLPYLSLNRRRLDLTLPEVDETTTVAAEPFSGWRASAWRSSVDGVLIVDDLDAGFAIRRSGADNASATQADAVELFEINVDRDQDLPVFPLGESDEWQRQELPTSFGKYRRTHARITAGEGETEAVFTVSLPTAGRWRLDFHVPQLRSTTGSVDATGGGGVVVSVSAGEDNARARLGSYDMRLLANGESLPVEFDGSASETGWNRLGEFQLPAQEVSLTISNRSSGKIVVVDAVRWRQVDAPAAVADTTI